MAPDVLWCGDLTEVDTGEGKLYLATGVLDLFSRRLLGYAMSKHDDDAVAVASLVVEGFGWCSPSECLVWPAIESGGYSVEVVTVPAGQVCALGFVSNVGRGLSAVQLAILSVIVLAGRRRRASGCYRARDDPVGERAVRQW
ncbi:DDE-type integrase/transposase/recombinase [Allorhizocola rhizosphaerae]|uniref:DDE-type integrase/transposase/recombinase n=1 Tax=Allorhizocola rhizosphaerae TaxID=1872709 RepID=UPI0013C2F6F5|nr:DDE-type integrase/transposase/recombinase [Allorhizocola rhizosphaerae]